MDSGKNKYPFFESLKCVARTVSNDVKEIERKMRSSKFELPENHAMFKLVDLSDEMTTYKNNSRACLQQLSEENEKYTHYRQDIEDLVTEMERSTDRVEDYLVGYGYQKWHPENNFEDDSSQFQSSTSHESPAKERLPVPESKNQPSPQKTPVLADYGLTTKSLKYLPSALKDKQGSARALTSAKKQVHFESPERQNERGKENVPYSLQKTPLLEDYGLPSKKRDQRFQETNQGKDMLCIKKQLNFRSPLRSITENATQNEETESFAVAEVDSSEQFKELVNSIPLGLKKSPPVEVSQARTDVKTCTPEDPFPLSCANTFVINKTEALTPEEPEIQPIRNLGISNKEHSETPEEPVATPLSHAFKNTEPSTPKTPEFEVTSSFREWLQLQKKK